MLSLEPPYYDIDGTLVYRDHAVPTQFYYAAPQPKISRTNGRLMFDLLMYSVELRHSPLAGTAIPDELGAGFLTMGVDCALSTTQRATLLRNLADRTGVPEDQIALYPIPYSEGSIRVLALDQFSTPGEQPSDVASEERLKGRPTFVEKIIGSAKPALLGDLRAIFSLSLSQEGVTFLQGLYAERAAPVGVVYELGFYGLRPAVEARVTANLSRINRHFGGGLSGQYQWFKADISAGLDFLEERGDIQIEITSQATGEEAQKSKELALSLFKDRIVQEMFRPTTPTPPSTSATTGLTGALGSLANTGKIGFTLRFSQSEELKTVTYDFRERSPEKRVHAPQGFLPLLISPAELQQRIHKIDLHNDFFEILEVLVTGPTKEEFDALGIRQVEANLLYGEPTDGVPPERQSILFRADSTGDKTFAVKRRGRRSLTYSGALTYEFARKAGADTDSFRYELPPRPHTGRTLRINPYEDFGLLDVEVEPGRIHPDVREVDVHLAYHSRDGSFGADEHFRLAPGGADAAAQRKRWQVRTLDTAIATYDAAYTFIFQDSAVYGGPVQQFTDPLLRVDSPFLQDRRLLIRPNVVSPQITEIVVEIEYQDPANNYQRRFLVSLEAPFASQEVSWPILDPNQQKARYRVTVHEPGFISEGEWEETSDPSIVVGTVGSRAATVQVRLIGATLADAGLDAVQLKLELAVPGSPSAETQSLLFQGDQISQDVKLVLPPGATLRYRYQTTAFKTSGQVVESTWKESTNSLLVITTRTL